MHNKKCLVCQGYNCPEGLPCSNYNWSTQPLAKPYTISVNKQIKIRIDEWCTKIETTSEGTFIYVDQEDKEDVMEELVRVLSDG